MLITELLRTVLDNKLGFNKYLDEKTNKCNNITDIMKKVSLLVLRKNFLTMYK